MAAAPTVPKLPLVAKSLIFDTASQALKIHASHPIPTPNPSKNDHLIHVKTTALCTRELLELITPGYDLGETVITAPPASPFKPGDDIHARTRPNRPGNYREYSIVRMEEMPLKPQKLNWVEAATVPMLAITAWQALFEHAGVKGLDDPNSARKRVLITAAAGGVGVWLVQLARIAGLKVVAQVGSAKNDEFVQRGEFEGMGRERGPVDIVFDLFGGKTLEDALFCVKEGGSLISIFEPPEGKRPEGLKNKGVKNEFFIITPNGQQLAEVSKLLNEGLCEVVVDSVWDFENYEKAFERLDGVHANGKVVIKVTE
ncbi:hypothetical protein MMC28_000799 [Mycoblastus sanguinarius]|nr:hypothetical protein [Mycoblastus sanguinarius]